MSFTPQHADILNQHREHYDTLRTSGYIRNLDDPLKKSLQLIYNEAVGPERFTRWCGDCVADMVQRLYRAFDEWQHANSVEVKTGENVQQKEVVKNRRERRALLDKNR